MSVLIFICANSFWWKVGSSIMMSVFGINLYVELYLDPTNWTKWDMWLLIIVGGNTLLVMLIVEKIKSKWQKPKS
jgi:phosphotransferase system  glucose/maltose/N-acetylglucosamine-specific IIC component